MENFRGRSKRASARASVGTVDNGINLPTAFQALAIDVAEQQQPEHVPIRSRAFRDFVPELQNTNAVQSTRLQTPPFRSRAVTVPVRQSFRGNNVTVQHITTRSEDFLQNNSREILSSLEATQHNALVQRFNNALYNFAPTQLIVNRMNPQAPLFVTNSMAMVPYVAPQLPPIASLLRPDFRSSRMNLNIRGQSDPSYAPLVRTNSNYRGERNSRLIRNLPDHTNCSLFITNIPVKTTIAEIFDVINTGAVSSLHVQPATNIHSTNAAFLVFMTPQGARAFKERGAWIRGQELTIVYNREGFTASYSNQSRVLLLNVPTHLINVWYWLCFFNSFCAFGIDRIFCHPSNVPGRGILEFRFMRIEGQSRMCMRGIQESPVLQHIVSVSYGRDPCRP
ncbi:hypothetical protein B0J14DRAFT_638660 [Halenospora varia]|nr:hypothetical protein B0J14DRAFT_638660 [Halenospora varia]